MTTRGLTRTWLQARDAVASIQAELVTAQAAVVAAEAAMIASLGDSANVSNGAVTVDGRVVFFTRGAATEGLLLEADDE